jgi:peptide-N4-(N-acetyl-beta-glucosaminyl)asparagine amidase
LPSYRDELLKQLLHWFKTEFFSWTNCPKCHVCGHEKTHHFRTEPPFTQEEIQGEASRVEIYQCFQCKSFTRFPRYNNPLKLLDTRHGRCGEWANCFTLCCRSMGFETRYVLDVTDHVWTEVFSEYEKRWLHCDSCENQLDCPLTYEIGWGKKLSYIFSFSHEEIVDSMRRYTQNYDDILYTRRHEVSEKWLSETICRMNQEIRQEISMERIAILQKREKIEKKEFEICQQQKKIKADEIHGRISGSKEWKDARNESGSISTTKFSKNNATLQVQHEEQDKEICTLMTTLTMKDTICQKLLLNLLKGCDNVKCPNPFCLHTQKRLRPGKSIASCVLLFHEVNLLQELK